MVSSSFPHFFFRLYEYFSSNIVGIALLQVHLFSYNQKNVNAIIIVEWLLPCTNIYGVVMDLFRFGKYIMLSVRYGP